MSELLQWVEGREALERDVAELRARFSEIEALLGQSPVAEARASSWRRTANGHLSVAREISQRRNSPALRKQIAALQTKIDAIVVFPAPKKPPAKVSSADAPPSKQSSTGKRVAKASARKAAKRAPQPKSGRPGGSYVAVYTDEPQTCKICQQVVAPYRRHADILDSHQDQTGRWCQGGVLPQSVTNALSHIAAAKRGETPRRKREDTRPIRVVSGGLPSLGRGN